MLQKPQSTGHEPHNNMAEEEDDVSDDDAEPEELEDIDRCPIILLSREEKRRMRKSWKTP